MTGCTRFVCATTFVLITAFSGNGQKGGTTWQQTARRNEEPATLWQQALRDWPWRYLASAIGWSDDDAPIAVQSLSLPHPVGVCAVAPLAPIDDPDAQKLEAGGGTLGVADVADMQPAAARALDRFESRVARAGGTMILKSAYRPVPYQRHLQNVWYKWMRELRNNFDPGCQDLRAQVQEEFTRHRLIETQHPVAVSDHTRGLAFDATVELPRNAARGRRRLTLDGLAHLAGLVRPAIVSDPVHFKYLGGRRSASLRRHPEA